MTLNRTYPWTEEVATSDKMNQFVSNQLVHVFTSDSIRDQQMNLLQPTAFPAGSVSVVFTNSEQTTARIDIRNQHSGFATIGGGGAGAVSDPLTLNSLVVSSITLGTGPEATRTSWPQPGAGQGVSTWADLTDTPPNYGNAGQIPVSLGAGTGVRFAYRGIAAILPDAVTFATSVTTGSITLNGITRNTWPAAGVNNFVDLHDVGVHALATNRLGVLRINAQGTSIEAVAASAIGGTFIGQSDTPNVWGTAGQAVVINSTANGLVFADAAGAANAVEFGAAFPASPSVGDVFALNAAVGSSGRGMQLSRTRTIQATTNTMTIEVQDQSYGQAGLEYFGFATHESRAGVGLSLVFGTQPPGFGQVKAVLWSINNTGGEIYVQVDADVTDQAQIVMRAFGNDYTLYDQTSTWNPPAVDGKAQKVYYASHLNLPARANSQRETISFWRTGNVGIGIPVGTAEVAQAYWEDAWGGRPVVSGVALPPVDAGFSLGDQFALTRAHGASGRGLHTLEERGVTTSAPVWAQRLPRERRTAAKGSALGL